MAEQDMSDGAKSSRTDTHPSEAVTTSWTDDGPDGLLSWMSAVQFPGLPVLSPFWAAPLFATARSARTAGASTFGRPSSTGAGQSLPVTAAVPGVAVAATSVAVPAQANAAATPLTTAAVVPQPAADGQIAGLALQNPTANAQAARYVSFGMNFCDGQIWPSQNLVAEINGGTEPVQMDVKTRHADGSVNFAVLTLLQPALPADASVPVMLARGSTQGPGKALDISSLIAAGYDVTVALTNVVASAYGTAGTTIPSSVTPIPDVTIDVAGLLSQALAGTAGAGISWWQQGPLATQVRIDSGPIPGTPMHLTFDITLYADGTISTDVQFNNDTAMQASLGTLPTSLRYDVAIMQTVDGIAATVLRQSNVTQWQYQVWNQQFWSNGPPGVNVQHDIAALEATGAVQTYDPAQGVATSLIGAGTARMPATAATGILDSGAIAAMLSGQGTDSGLQPLPLADTLWLLTQDPGAAALALAQANQAGTVPWNFYDAGTSTVLTLAACPALWSAGSTPGAGGLAQQIGQTGITGVPSSVPDLAYAAYLLTGQQVYLNRLNAEAGAAVLATPPPARGGGQGILGGAGLSIGWQASTLREVVEAAAANPDGSAMKAYFTQLAANNIRFFLQEAASAGEGAVSGWFAGLAASGEVSPQQQDYLATTFGMAAGLGIPGARQILGWMSNFVSGLFLNGASGLSPTDGADAVLQLADPVTGAAFTTWAQVASASRAAGLLGTGQLSGDPTTLALARAALAECITYAGSTNALRAYGWLMANAPALASTIPQQDPTLDIVPRLSDGQLLTSAQVFIRTDSGAPATVSETNADQMICETGSAQVVIVGGSGINILIGGAGTTTLVGGPAADDLFAGSGATTFKAGGGNDFMLAGSGAAEGDMFLLSPGDVGNDMIAGFRVGTDHLQVAGAAAGSAALLTLLAGMTQDAAGNAVLHLSASHQVTLQGIAEARVTGSLFV